MIELIQFYSKNALHLLLFVSIGFIIAMMDVSFRKIVKKVYLNVRKNIQIRHGGLKEGLDMASIDKLEEKSKEDPIDKKDKKGGKKGGAKKTGDGDGGEEGDEGEEGGECPKDCEAVVKLQERLTKLIADATKLKEDVKNNNIIIEKQEKIIVELQKNVNDLVAASSK
jgi:hypothetical protein